MLNLPHEHKQGNADLVALQHRRGAKVQLSRCKGAQVQKSRFDSVDVEPVAGKQARERRTFQGAKVQRCKCQGLTPWMLHLPQEHKQGNTEQIKNRTEVITHAPYPASRVGG